MTCDADKVHAGERDDGICSAGFDGIEMGQNNSREKDGKQACGICGVELDLWEQRRVNKPEGRT